MNKSELVRAVYESKTTKLSMIEIDAVVSEMLSIMSDKLQSCEGIQLAGFGSFSIKSASAKKVLVKKTATAKKVRKNVPSKNSTT